MAVVKGLEEISSIENIKLYDTFKQQFVLRMLWKEAGWKSIDENAKTVDKIVSICHYWFNCIIETRESNVLVLTLLNNGRLINVDTKLLLIDFKQKIGLNGLLSYHITRNTNFIVLNFENQESREKAAEKFLFCRGHIVINSDWIFKREELFLFRINWLPATLDLMLIQNEIIKYCNVVMIEKEQLRVDEEDVIKSGDVIGLAEKNKNQNKEEIPQIIEIKNYQGLIIIPGRRLMCLRCFEYGHKAAGCKRNFCQFCKRKIDRRHNCNYPQQVCKRINKELSKEEKLDNKQIRSQAQQCSTENEVFNLSVKEGGKGEGGLFQGLLKNDKKQEMKDLSNNMVMDGAGVVQGNIVSSVILNKLGKEESTSLRQRSFNYCKSIKEKKQAAESSKKVKIKHLDFLVQFDEQQILDLQIEQSLSKIRELDKQEIEYLSSMEKDRDQDGNNIKKKVKMKNKNKNAKKK